VIYGMRDATAWSWRTHFLNAASMFFTSSAASGFMCARTRRETFMSLVINVSTHAWFGKNGLKYFHWCLMIAQRSLRKT